MNAYPHRDQRTYSGAINDELIRAYMAEMGENPILSREEELHLALKMRRARKRLRLRLLACAPVLQSVMDVLQRIHSRELRLDRYIDVAVSDVDEKQRVRRMLPRVLSQLNAITRRLKDDFRVAIHPDSNMAERRGAWRRVVAGRYRAAMLVEKVNLRTSELCGLLPKVKSDLRDMQSLQQVARRARRSMVSHRVWRGLRRQLLSAMVSQCDSPATLERRTNMIDRHQSEYENLKREFACSNLRFVISVLKHYRNIGLDLSDLIQEGNVGLMRAIEKFDPKRGYRFTTYADRWIRQEISQAISRTSGTISIPHSAYIAIREVRKVSSSLAQTLGREPRIEEIAESTGKSAEQAYRIVRLATKPASLHQCLSEEDGSQLADLIEDVQRGEQEHENYWQELAERVEHVMQILSPREREILRLRYGLGDGVELTLAQIGQRFRLTKERIRQIERRAVQKLQHPVCRRALADLVDDCESTETASTGRMLPR